MTAAFARSHRLRRIEALLPVGEKMTEDEPSDPVIHDVLLVAWLSAGIRRQRHKFAVMVLLHGQCRRRRSASTSTGVNLLCPQVVDTGGYNLTRGIELDVL